MVRETKKELEELYPAHLCTQMTICFSPETKIEVEIYEIPVFT